MVKFNNWDYANYYHTILDNPYIDFELYDKQQLLALTSCQDREGINEALIGGAGGGGKTKLLSALALQFIEFPQYRCLVTRKNYRELVGTGSVFDILKNIDGLKSTESKLIKITAPSGAEIHFKAFNDKSHKQDVKGESYHTILNDEASELEESVLKFLYRSLRRKADDWIPLRFINASNPGGDSTNYLVEKYVDGDLPYIDMSYKDNPFINTKTYEESLSNLDYIDQQYQMHGNWHYKPKAGDLIDYDELTDAYIDVEDYNQREVQLCTMGMDTAGKGRDNTVPLSLICLDNGLVVLNDLEIDGSAYPEDTVCEIVERQCIENDLYAFGNEEEPGGDALYATRYWKKDVLEDLIHEYGFIFKGMRPSKSKFTRARPLAKAVKDGKLKFSYHLKKKLERENGLFDQFIYVSPDPEIMKTKKSPDELDALGYAWQLMKKYVPSI
ncbi:MAG: terminase family protein [Methanobrevibacter sp.]|nr:terminase family protein [Methanobrevibacter sp.]MBR1748871.1 terminase family protein [Bacilli bacterium]